MADRFYNLQQVAAMLTTTRMTLRKWLLEEGMKTRVNPGNEKERQLSWEQITVLATAKRRILPADPSAPAADPLAALEARLSAQIAAERRARELLARRVEQLEQRVADHEQPTLKTPAVARQEPQQTALPAPVVEHHPRGYARKQEPVLALQAMHALVRAHFAPQLNAEPERIGRARLEQEPNISQADLTARLIPLWQPLRGFHHCQDKSCPCQRL